MNYLKVAQSRLDRFGWEVVETKINRLHGLHRDDNSPVYVRQRAWSLKSLWQPTDYDPVLGLEANGLRLNGGDFVVRFDERFEKKLDKLLDHLQELRAGKTVVSYRELTILGASPGLSRTDVENTHGAPSFEALSYDECYDYRKRESFDLERLTCSYGALQVVYYQDESEEKVLEVFGSQIEGDGTPIFFAGEKYEPDDSAFAWRALDWVQPWEAERDKEGWWRFQPSRGFFRLDKDRRYKEFRLGTHWGDQGKRVPPLT